MNSLILIAALATIPMDAHIVREGVDLLEVNTMYDGDGQQHFQQLIGWDWNGYAHEVAGWRSMAGKVWRPPNVVWMDGPRLFVIRGKYWREFHSQFDPEMEQREILKPCHRRGLFGEVP